MDFGFRLMGGLRAVLAGGATRGVQRLKVQGLKCRRGGRGEAAYVAAVMGTAGRAASAEGGKGSTGGEMYLTRLVSPCEP